jgi:hypothetical protein
VVDRVALGLVFREYFLFPCQFSFQRLLHTHYLSYRAGTLDQLVADVPIGLRLTPPQETKKKKRRTLSYPDRTIVQSSREYKEVIMHGEKVKKHIMKGQGE